MLAGRSDGISKSWENPAVRAARIDGIKAAAADPRMLDGEHSDPLPGAGLVAGDDLRVCDADDQVGVRIADHVVHTRVELE